MTAGYWFTTYFQNSASGRYWADDYWQDFAVVAPVDVASGPRINRLMPIIFMVMGYA
jgi:hypothetical protein